MAAVRDTLNDTLVDTLNDLPLEGSLFVGALEADDLSWLPPLVESCCSGDCPCCCPAPDDIDPAPGQGPPAADGAAPAAVDAGSAAAAGAPAGADVAEGLERAEGAAGEWSVPGVSRPPVAPVLPPLLTDLTAALDDLDGHGPLSGSPADTLALLRAAERARGLALRELGELVATGVPLPGGPRATPASWLRDSQLLGDDAARASVRLAAELRDTLPQIGSLLRAGGTTLEHAAAVATGVRGLDESVVADTDAAGAFRALAAAATPPDIRTTLRDKACAIDPRLAADADRKARDRQGLRLSQVGAHTVVDGTIASQDGATVRLAFDLAVEAARTAGDTRGRAARSADVLLGWANDYLTRAHGPGDSLDSDVHTVRTHLLISCTPGQLAQAVPSDSDLPSLSELLHRDLAGAPPVSPGLVGEASALTRGALRRLACDATLDLIVRGQIREASIDGQHIGTSGAGTSGDGTSGAGQHPGTSGAGTPGAGTQGAHLTAASNGAFDPLYVGRSSRTVTRQQFKALVARDRTCVVRGCPHRPSRCAAHHVKHWADGGSTDLNNLVLLCHQHHHDHHDRGQDLPHRDGKRLLARTGWCPAPS